MRFYKSWLFIISWRQSASEGSDNHDCVSRRAEEEHLRMTAGYYCVCGQCARIYASSPPSAHNECTLTAS